MTIETLQAFIYLVENGSITKAAEKLFISPQGLSYSISSLEQELGATLFERTSKGVKLTVAGEMVLDDINNLLDSWHSVREHLKELRKQDDNQIHIGVINSLNEIIAPLLYEEFLVEHPTIQLFVEECHSHEINAELLANRLQLALVLDLYPHRDVKLIPIKKESWCVLVNKNSEMAECSFMTNDDFAGKDMALPNHNYNCLNYVRAQCKSRGIDFNTKLSYGANTRGIVQFLLDDRGMVFCTTYVARAMIKEPAILAIPIQDNLDSFYTCIAYRKNQRLSEQIKHLIKYLKRKATAWPL